MRIITAFALLIAFATRAYSATLNVPGEYSSIQGAVEAAANGDTVLVAPGTYKENLDFLGKAILVKSAQGAEGTIIDGGTPQHPDYGSVATFKSGEGLDSRLEGFTLTNGKGTNYQFYPTQWFQCGGGVFCEGSSPTLVSNKIVDNTADFNGRGGGIFCKLASPAIIGNVISGNRAEAYGMGGGVFCMDSNLILANNRIMRNYVEGHGGGGIWASDSNSVVTGNEIILNETDSYSSGGGIECSGYAEISGNLIASNTTGGNGAGINAAGSFKITGNTIVMNRAIDNYTGINNGGGIYCGTDSSGTIERNTIIANVATKGGAVYAWKCSLEMTGNLMAKNSAVIQGGGINCYECDAEIANQTIFGNSALYGGGGIRCEGCSVPALVNTILWGNSAAEGPEIWIGQTSVVTTGHSDVKGGQASVYVDSGSTLTWGDGMIDVNPQFADAPNADLHLTYTSPCRDAGDNAAVLDPLDFEGDPRIAQGAVDLGADEFYRHFYITGEKRPGGNIQGKLVGMPGAHPLALFLGSGVLEPPLQTKWGFFFLETPWVVLPLPSLQIPANGILTLPATLPMEPRPPYDLPLQALIGWNPDALSNLEVLQVR